MKKILWINLRRDFSKNLIFLLFKYNRIKHNNKINEYKFR